MIDKSRIRKIIQEVVKNKVPPKVFDPSQPLVWKEDWPDKLVRTTKGQYRWEKSIGKLTWEYWADGRRRKTVLSFSPTPNSASSWGRQFHNVKTVEQAEDLIKNHMKRDPTNLPL